MNKTDLQNKGYIQVSLNVWRKDNIFYECISQNKYDNKTFECKKEIFLRVIK